MRSYYFISVEIIFLIGLSVTASGQCDYEELLTKEYSITHLTEICPEFATNLVNDPSVQYRSKLPLLKRYKSMLDGEYSLYFGCECYDFVKRTHENKKGELQDTELLLFLIQNATCDPVFPRWEHMSYSDFISFWKQMKVRLKNERIGKEIDRLLDFYQDVTCG